MGAVTREAAEAAKAAGKDPTTVWGKKGRIGIYSANFGDIRRVDFNESAVTALSTVSSMLVAVQEATPELRLKMQEAGWLVTDAKYAVGKQAHGEGMLVCGWQGPVDGLQVSEMHSGRRGPDNMPCSQMFVKATFRFGVAGRGEFVLGNIHIHREVAKRDDNSPVWQNYVEQLANSIRACDANALVGDANMGLFRLAADLERHNIQATLVANHAELTLRAPIDIMDSRKVREALLYDSCGIWILTPLVSCKRLTLDTQCILGALHPSFLERHNQDKLKAYNRGFPIESYVGASAAQLRTRQVPSEESLTTVLKLWDFHEVKVVKHNSKWLWSLDLQDRTSESWRLAAEWVPKEGEKRQVIRSKTTYVRTYAHTCVRVRATARTHSTYWCVC